VFLEDKAFIESRVDDVRKKLEALTKPGRVF
jgi:hypothetical protein